MGHSTAQTIGKSMIGLAIAALIAVAIWGVVAYQPREPEKLGDEFRYDRDETMKVDPARIGWVQLHAIPLAQDGQCVAVDDAGAVYIGIADGLAKMNATGEIQKQTVLDGLPTSVAVAPEGEVYVTFKEGVVVLNPDLSIRATWDKIRGTPHLTGVAVGPESIFVADAGNRLVYRYTPQGRRLGEIGKRDESMHAPGFKMPSPNLDVVLDNAGELRINNPGFLRVETYTVDGFFEEGKLFGQAGTTLEAFIGCCNPARLAVLPDGRIVTSEKGAPRVKVFTADGVFDSAVAGPDSFASKTILDLATGPDGLIYVLDTTENKLHVYREADKDTSHDTTE